MKITPLEVHNHQFSTGFRGFDRDEVRAFLAMVSEEFEHAIAECNKLKDQLAESKGQLAESRNRERGLQTAIEAADRIATEMKDTARRECEIVMREAQVKAARLVDQAQARVISLEERVSELRMARSEFESRLRSLLEQYMRGLEAGRQEASDEDQDRIFLLRRPNSA